MLGTSYLEDESIRRSGLWPREWGRQMKLRVIVHEAEEGGYWAEVPSIPGCATQAENVEELLKNLAEAVEGCLSADIPVNRVTGHDRILEIAL